MSIAKCTGYNPNPDKTDLVYVVDKDTRCEYITTEYGDAITPRLDGKGNPMGCEVIKQTTRNLK